MKMNHWRDWLEAQRHWKRLVLGGYKYHSPESVYLATNRGAKLDDVLSWCKGNPFPSVLGKIEKKK